MAFDVWPGAVMIRTGWVMGAAFGLALMTVGCSDDGATSTVGGTGAGSTAGAGSSTGPDTPTTTQVDPGTTGADAVCGDGKVDPGEDCDNGGANGPGDACKADCSTNTCGDGELGPGEGCDNGNQTDDDACSSTCKSSSCGDGEVVAPEMCDDGNVVHMVRIGPYCSNSIFYVS